MEKLQYSIDESDHLLNGHFHKQVIAQAQAAGLDIYVVGGYLRDLVLRHFNPNYKITSKDIDYAIEGGLAFDFARTIADKVGGHFVALDKSNDTARVVMDDGHTFDFAGCVGGSIEQDILRRDFTINALYLEPQQPDHILDLVGGISDIKDGIIRSLNESVLISDPLRILRAFRFAATFGFNIEAQTLAWLKNNVNSIDQVAGERTSSELFLTLNNKSDKQLKLAADIGLLEAIFPELKDTRRVTNNAYHHLNLFDHSVEAVVKVEQEISTYDHVWCGTNLFENMQMGISHLAVCKIASLLHDIGKPSTWVITEEGKHTFIGHESIGAQMVPAIAQRLRWSNAVENLVTILIALHLRPGQLFHQSQASAKGINRLYRRAGKDFPALILLAFGDLAATQGPQMTAEKSEFLRLKFYELLTGFYEYTRVAESLEKLLDGNDIMKLLNLEPGKELGRLLNALQEAQELKEVVTREDAENLMRTLHNQENK